MGWGEEAAERVQREKNQEAVSWLERTEQRWEMEARRLLHLHGLHSWELSTQQPSYRIDKTGAEVLNPFEQISKLRPKTIFK